MQSKPVVDGLTRDLAGTAEVVRVDLTTRGGQEIARRYRIVYTPALVVLDPRGELAYRLVPDYMVASPTPAIRVLDSGDREVRRMWRLTRAPVVELVRSSM